LKVGHDDLRTMRQKSFGKGAAYASASAADKDLQALYRKAN
jgi:hypothetical protein